MKKKMLVYLLAGVMTLSLTGCASASSSGSAETSDSSAAVTEAASSEETSAESSAPGNSSESGTESSSETASASRGSSEEQLVTGIHEDTPNISELFPTDIYEFMKTDDSGEEFPSKFDLRDKGVVTSVKYQGDWGTCWGFASIGASETSILSELGMTTEEFLTEYGEDFDLSERHLAWFGLSHLPETSEYAEGEYPYEVSQAGEGLYIESTDSEMTETAKRFSLGGKMLIAAQAFSSGTGPVWESMAPYQANDGSSDISADWSLPEDSRFGVSFELTNSSILPSPSGRDENGNYVYNPAGTEAIKEELYAGRGVTCTYHSDRNVNPDAAADQVTDKLFTSGWFSDAELDRILILMDGEVLPETDEDFLIMAKIKMMTAGKKPQEVTDQELQESMAALKEKYQEDLASSQSAAAAESSASDSDASDDDAVKRQAADAIGLDYDNYLLLLKQVAEATADDGIYINAETAAQYVDTLYAMPDHAVEIIGWDDDYDVSNFPADHQPPANGAWIVKNSWSTAFGKDGYFYLSYYDQSINVLESFEYDVSEKAQTVSEMSILSYSYMPSMEISAVQLEGETSMANVFPVEDDCTLNAVSVLTTGLNASVTADVYLLNENASSPTDGQLIDTVSADYKYAGYHRMALKGNYQLKAGQTISVVETEKLETSEGTRYVVPYTRGTNQEFGETQNIISGQTRVSYTKGIVNENESYVLLDGEWTDWKTILDEVSALGGLEKYATYDNLSIKAYIYPAEDAGSTASAESSAE